MRMGTRGRSFRRDVVGRTQACLILKSWWRRWCAVRLRAGDGHEAATAAGAAETVACTNVLGLGMWDRSRRLGFREDAPFEELGKEELRGGISERDISRVAAVAGAMCVTEVFTQ